MQIIENAGRYSAEDGQPSYVEQLRVAALTVGTYSIPDGTADERFVQALYLLLFDRTAGAAEVQGWVRALPQMGTQGAAQLFLTSREFRTNLVESYYNVLLHRPSDAGRDGWVSSSMDAISMRIGFESSSEFFTNG